MTKEYICEWCGERFSKAKDLARHRNECPARPKEQKVTRVKGLEIHEGDCLKVIYGRYAWIVKIKERTSNPLVWVCEDIYGHELTLDLSRAVLIQRLSEEDYERRKRR